jgi:hypothetical protein
MVILFKGVAGYEFCVLRRRGNNKKGTGDQKDLAVPDISPAPQNINRAQTLREV